MDYDSRVTTLPSWPAIRPHWMGYVGVWVLLMVLCGPQTMWSGAAKSWSQVFWIQVIYWTTWAIISPAIFWLCRHLYEGPRTWKRYVPGLLVGIVGVSLLQPIIENVFYHTKEWIEWSLSLRTERPTDFFSRVSLAMKKGSGTNPFMFAVIAIVWYAWRYAGDLRAKQIKSLELESRLRESQLQALRSQLNPHFLFNTLHSIAELVHSDPDLAEQLILRLGELLRKALASSGRQEIALSDELDFIRAYLDIEQMRLGDRLKLNWDIAGDVLAIQVPSLLLQPLVENAIQHGIASTTKSGALQIRARRDREFLHLQVCDSGPGLPQSSEASNGGIGLANTAARLRALYGDRHRFELVSNGGLTVNMLLPIEASFAPTDATT